MVYYKDLREHVRALEASNKLFRMKRPINKDTELHPLVRWQFRGLREAERKAFLFENVVDVKGKKYGIPVVVGCHAASSEIYAIAMQCRPDQIMEKWTEAQLHPVEPRIVKTGPVHEEVHMGNNLLEHGGLEEFPIPISTPGFDNAPYLTAANWVSKDPETDKRNVGNYRAMMKSPTRLGLRCLAPQHLRVHWQKCRARGMPSLPAAIVLGATPNVGLTATMKLPYGLDEFAVAGGIAGEPLELVKCKTVDIEVPASAEIVIEGEVPTDYLEREGPFGEYNGYIETGWSPSLYFNVTCITHRKTPMFNAFISQFPPSESSKLRGISLEAAIYNFLKHHCNIPGILDVALHEASGAWYFLVIKMAKASTAQSWQALHLVTGYESGAAKIVVAVDEDIDARDLDAVTWALCYRVQPQRDIQISQGKAYASDPSSGPAQTLGRGERAPGSALLVDATRKWAYPPVSLPKREFMEKARQIWETEGLPKLSPKMPWFGYSLGYWPQEMEEEAQLALKGEHYQTGEKLAKSRTKCSP